VKKRHVWQRISAALPALAAASVAAAVPARPKPEPKEADPDGIVFL